MSKQNKHHIKGKKKHSDLQPFLDYFSMLREYVEKGYMQLDVKEHAVYITQPAIHAMSPGNDPAVQLRDGSIENTAFRIRAYVAWLSGEGNDYLDRNFSVHVVKDEEPHDLIFTLLFSQPRGIFRTKPKVEVITYPKK